MITKKDLEMQIEMLVKDDQHSQETIVRQAKEIEKLKNEKAILEKAFRLVIQHDIGKINYAELDRANKAIEEFYKNNKELRTINKQNKSIEELVLEIERLNMIIEIKTDRIQQLMKRLFKRQEKVDKLNNIIKHTDSWLDRTIEIIKQQPSEDDTWILERLNSFKIILRGDNNE